jgi:outer membrane lipoprotein-sorting protein
MRGRVVLFVLLVVLSGCMGLGGDESSAPDGETAAQGYDSLESVEGTVEIRTVVDSDPTTDNDTTTIHSVRRPGEGLVRQEFISPSGRAGDVTASNGSVTWIYNATTNEVLRFTIGNESAANTSLATLVERVFGNLSTSEEDAAIVAPLRPIARSSSDTQTGSATTGFFGGGTQRVNLTYLGTETIAERQTHRVRLTPTNASEDSTSTSDTGGIAQHIQNVTYWFDAEYFHPLRTETVVRIDGNVTRSVQAYRNVTFNTDPDPETFQFDPPANATVRSSPAPRSFDSVAAASETVDFAVADPDPPEGFAFETAQVLRSENRTTLSVRYSDGTDSFAVSSQRPPFDGREGERVSLGPVNGTRVTSGELVAVAWRCGDTEYVVSGRLPVETAESVAREAVAVCPDETASGGHSGPSSPATEGIFGSGGYQLLP